MSQPLGAGLLLAAGAGTRLGQPKALVSMDGELLVRRGARLLATAGCTPVVVVLGAAADQVPPLDDVVIVRNEDWATGMGSSLRAGLGALPVSVDAVVVALVDQPVVAPDAVRRLLAALTPARPAAVAAYDGAPRTPVALHRSVWTEVGALAVGDRGARAWLRANPHRVSLVECGDVARADDVDTVDDLVRLAATDLPNTDERDDSWSSSTVSTYPSG